MMLADNILVEFLADFTRSGDPLGGDFGPVSMTPASGLSSVARDGAVGVWVSGRWDSDGSVEGLRGDEVCHAIG